MKALITGINGQTGSYLAELLLEKGYEVHGMVRRGSTHKTERIDHILDKIKLHIGDIEDVNSITKILQEVMPNEIYNFAAMSQVRISYEIPSYTGKVTGIGFANLIEAVRLVCPQTKVYQASSSEMFGKVLEVPQRETTPCPIFEGCEFVEGGTEITDMNELASCEHQIIANSSFSWWAAWLNPNPNKIVIAPKQWFANPEHDKQFIDLPKSWTRI